MTLVYPDTSIIVSAYTEEVSSLMAETWLQSVDVASLTASPWCETEVAAALGAKARAGFVTGEEKDYLRTVIRRLLRDVAIMLPITHRHFTDAADLLSRSAKPLRASDALHLAIAADAKATLWTLDKPMAGAGQALGLDVRLLT